MLVLLIGCGGDPSPERIATTPGSVTMPAGDAELWPRPVAELSVLGDALCTEASCWRIGDGWSTKPTTLSIADAREAIKPEPSIPLVVAAKTVRQASFAFRVGCALTASNEVWCWSDPKRPRKIAAPTDVDLIAVLDPLALCVHTAAGDVACTPPVAPTGYVYCHNENNECRLRAEMDQPKGPAFDPIQPLTRPLVSERLPFPAMRFARDEYQVFPIVPDIIEAMYFDPHVGGCVLGAAGEVACVHSCGATTRGNYRVRLPPVASVRSDLTTGYGVTATGELWTWPRIPAECTRDATITAQRAEVPAIAQLAPLLHYDGRRKFGTNIRCVALRDGDIRCWEPREDGGLGTVFDPASPPAK